MPAPVTVTITEVPGVPEEGGATAQEAMFDAALLQATPTVPANPPSPLIITENGADEPLTTPAVAGTVRLKSQTVPETAIECGLPLALSVIVMFPDVAPTAAPVGGAKVTLIVHVPAGATGAVVQLSVSVKFADVDWICVMVSAAVPVFDTVNGCAVLLAPISSPPKLKLVGLIPITGPPDVPVPESATRSGWFAPSSPSVMLIVAVSAATTEGVKMTPTVQIEPAAIEVVQAGPAGPAVAL